MAAQLVERRSQGSNETKGDGAARLLALIPPDELPDMLTGVAVLPGSDALGKDSSNGSKSPAIGVAPTEQEACPRRFD